jgi:hypothetical protein
MGCFLAVQSRLNGHKDQLHPSWVNGINLDIFPLRFQTFLQDATG